jgi:hypothetical protein
MCTLLTQNICLMCHTQLLDLSLNKIGDAGLTALAKAVESGALDQLQVCWRPTALSPCLETPHVHSPDSEHLFDVPYAGA